MTVPPSETAVVVARTPEVVVLVLESGAVVDVDDPVVVLVVDPAPTVDDVDELEVTVVEEDESVGTVLDVVLPSGVVTAMTGVFGASAI